MNKLFRFFAAVMAVAVLGGALNAGAQTYNYFGSVTSGGIGVPGVTVVDPNGAIFLTDANGNWQHTLGPNYPNNALFKVSKTGLDLGAGLGAAQSVLAFPGFNAGAAVVKALTYGQITAVFDTRLYTGININTRFPDTGEQYNQGVDSGGAFTVYNNTPLPQVENVTAGQS